MGILRRKSLDPRARKEPVLVRETRSGGWFNDGWNVSGLNLGGAMAAHPPVPTWLSESLSAVTACLEITTSAIASLPASITMDTDEGRQPAPATLPAIKLVARPNTNQSWPAFITQGVAELQMQGNFLAWVQRDGRGAVTDLIPVPWVWISPQIVSVGGAARLVYDITTSTPETRLLGLPSRLLDTEVLHVRARSDNGLIGRSVLARAAGVVRESLEMASVAENNWKNGMRPSGYISTPEYIAEDNVNRALEILSEYRGSVNAGKVPLLEGGWKFNQTSLNSVDAEFLSSRQFGVAEICRLFRVPEPLVQLGQRLPADMSPFMAAFAQLALAPIVAVLEAEFDAAVLPPGFHLQMDMGGLLRGNYSAVAAANCAQVQSGIMTANEARAAVGLPPHADGEVLRGATGGATPLAGKLDAPNWPADMPGMPSLAPKPGHTGDGLPAPGTHQNGGAA
ncbi:phage portal protein [Acetobacter sp.]|jgi:HK97 family phage portal protein|uniref:phage portal protein n=1 Tax=Acetobacter sp. TaxID=440 RepID=UPI0025B7CAB5|nr:phage portal protein [Acetobacter sp.]MCH4091076.1 phage portal protein [Acetobacter sp.]MCI1300259.1 phage portal protein [Acetobacter sp.]MCI1316073.1 phage portal protein [Acetobacter sp.]